MLSEHADGIIVGSAIVRKIEEHLSEGRDVLVQKVGELAAELAAGVR
jgi:tryptophan synthase alpha subunit